MLNCLEPDTTQVIEYCWCEHTILTRNINVPLLSSKCYSITHLSINIFLFCPNITNVCILTYSINRFHYQVRHIKPKSVPKYCLLQCLLHNRNISEFGRKFEHISKTHSITESIKICRFKTFWVEYFA